MHSRKRLLRDYPELFAKRMATMHHFQMQMTTIVARKIATDHPDKDAAAVEEEARLLVLISEGVMRHAWTCWADDTSATELAARLRSTFDRLPSLLAE